MAELRGVIRAFMYGGAGAAGAVTMLTLGAVVVGALAQRAFRREWAEATSAVRQTVAELGGFHQCGVCNSYSRNAATCDNCGEVAA